MQELPLYRWATLRSARANSAHQNLSERDWIKHDPLPEEKKKQEKTENLALGKGKIKFWQNRNTWLAIFNLDQGCAHFRKKLPFFLNWPSLWNQPTGCCRWEWKGSDEDLMSRCCFSVSDGGGDDAVVSLRRPLYLSWSPFDRLELPSWSTSWASVISIFQRCCSGGGTERHTL